MASMDKDLSQAMADLGIKEEDLRETFTHAGGRGGQNVNKVATCVLLVHVPSGLRVRAEEARSQGLNRAAARRRLVEKMRRRLEAEKLARRQLAEKKKRQARRPSKNARRRNVENKRRRGEIKRGREKVRGSE